MIEKELIEDGSVRRKMLKKKYEKRAKNERYITLCIYLYKNVSCILMLDTL